MSGPNPDTSTGPSARVRDLRAALGLTQEQVATRGGLTRTDVNKVENGRNQATSHAVHKGLARGFGLTSDDLDLFFDGSLSVQDAAARARPPRAADEPAQPISAASAA